MNNGRVGERASTVENVSRDGFENTSGSFLEKVLMMQGDLLKEIQNQKVEINQIRGREAQTQNPIM